MTGDHLRSVALALVAERKGILAADETVPTLTKRFDALGIPTTEQSRRSYREMLFTSPGAAEFISGAIMQDETIRQKSAAGIPMVDVQVAQGVVPGIKVDTGAKPLAGSRQETVTEGLDGLRERLPGTMQWGRFASGARSSMSPSTCRLLPVSVPTHTHWRGTPPSARSRRSGRSSSRRYLWTSRTRSSAAKK